MGCDADMIRGARNADISSGAQFEAALEIPFPFCRVRLERHHTAVESIGAGIHDAKLRVMEKALANLRSELVDAGVDNFGTNLLVEVERGLQADHHGKIRSAEPGKTVRLQIVIIPVGGSDVHPKIPQAVITDEKRAGSLW